MTDIEKKAREYADEVLKQALLMYDKDASEFLAENAYHAYLQGMKDTLSNQWREAEKEKPEDGEMVLIRYFGSISGDKNEIHHCEMRYNSEAKFGLIERMLKPMGVKITHWMPIPPIPDFTPKKQKQERL